MVTVAVVWIEMRWKLETSEPLSLTLQPHVFDKAS